MASTVSWIDFDSASQQRAQRMMALFRERDTRDELGLGSIRDAISDSLFPGTSIIQTRLRYMLFVPWMYRQLEARGVSSARIRERSRAEQLRLAAALKSNAPNELGIIGLDVGDRLKTLPSAIYWAGLRQWGLRLYPGTETKYQHALDDVYHRRKRGKAKVSMAIDGGDDAGGLWELAAYTFHPGLPEPPSEFSEDVDFRLTGLEARYLQERVRQSCGGSLLSWLLSNPVKVDIAAAWQHPRQADFSPEHRELLRHARMFSKVSYGAVLSYNQQLAKIVGKEDRLEEHRRAGEEWLGELLAEIGEVERWASEPHVFWAAVQGQGHDIATSTRSFIEQWITILLDHGRKVFDSPVAQRLVREREIQKKKANSRFTNARVRDQWGGGSGLRPMVYRWPVVQSYVADMAAALR